MRELYDKTKAEMDARPPAEPTGEWAGCNEPQPGWQQVDIPVELYAAIKELYPESRPPFRAARRRLGVPAHSRRLRVAPHRRLRRGPLTCSGRGTAGAMLDDGADLRDVQAALGHADLRVLHVYLKRRQADSRLREVMGQRSYLGTTHEGAAV